MSKNFVLADPMQISHTFGYFKSLGILYFHKRQCHSFQYLAPKFFVYTNFNLLFLFNFWQLMSATVRFSIDSKKFKVKFW